MNGKDKQANRKVEKIIECAYLLLKVVVQTALQRYSLAVKAVRSVRSTVTDITVRAVGGYNDTVLGITG